MSKNLKNLHQTQYSVLMSVYINDNPRHVEAAIESILAQTVSTNDFIIVTDGPVSSIMFDLISRYARENQNIRCVELSENGGLANALNQGLLLCKNELVARMDADDLSLPDRIELQLAAFNRDPSLGLVGGQLKEFSESVENIVGKRIVPQAHDDIVAFSKCRSPFNHPTVMYRRDVITRLGGYDTKLRRSEDYDLWMRLISAGVKCANVAESVLLFRLDGSALARRKRWSTVKEQIQLRVRFYRQRKISFFDLMKVTIGMLLLWLLPKRLAYDMYIMALRRD